MLKWSEKTFHIEINKLLNVILEREISSYITDNCSATRPALSAVVWITLTDVWEMLSVKLIAISGPKRAKLTIKPLSCFYNLIFIYFKMNIWWTMGNFFLLWVEFHFSSKYISRAVYFCSGNETSISVQHCKLTYIVCICSINIDINICIA